MNSFLKQLVKNIGDESASVAEDGVSSAEFSGYIDTGSLVLNGQISGTIFGGMPNNKILGLAGEEATGKTFFALGLVRHFMETHDEAAAAWYMSEPAVTKQMLVDREIDPKRVMFAEPQTVEDFRTLGLQTLEAYLGLEEKPPFMMVLDSLGQLSTNKELADALAGNDVKDMTRTQLIRGAFRTLSLKLAKAAVPMIVTNHTYAQMDQYKPREMSGGGGLKYAADALLFLTRSADKDKDTKEVYGDIIHCSMKKNRFARRDTKVDVRLDYDTGLDRYYGLLPLALAAGVFVKKAKGMDYDGKTVYEKDVVAEPEKFYTDEVLQIIDEQAKKTFKYGQHGEVDATDTE